MTTGYSVNGVDLASIFSAKGASTAAATGYKTAGTDLNQQLLALVDGQAISTATGYSVHGADLNTIFGVSASTLPINGQTLNFPSTLSGSTQTAGGSFLASTSGWSINSTPSHSGSLPAGAVSVQYAWSFVSGNNTYLSVTNGASSRTTLTSSNVGLLIATTVIGSTPGFTNIISATVTFYNSAGSAISTSTFRFQERIPPL